MIPTQAPSRPENISDMCVTVAPKEHKKATTKNFGEPLKNTSDYEFINEQTNDNIDYNN